MTRPLFFFYLLLMWKENGDYKMQTLVHLNTPTIETLDGQAAECRLCKHCGCMLNTDYIFM